MPTAEKGAPYPDRPPTRIGRAAIRLACWQERTANPWAARVQAWFDRQGWWTKPFKTRVVPPDAWQDRCMDDDPRSPRTATGAIAKRPCRNPFCGAEPGERHEPDCTPQR